MKIWEDHLDFVLGATVYGRTLKDADSGATYRPRWAQVLNYELELRKEAFRLVRKRKATNFGTMTQGSGKSAETAVRPPAVTVHFFVLQSAVAQGQLTSHVCWPMQAFATKSVRFLAALHLPIDRFPSLQLPSGVP